MTLKKLLFMFLITILIAIGIIYYIDNQKAVLKQPLIPQEDEEQVMEEIQPEEEETEEDVQQENSLTERVSTVFQETLDRIFQREVKIVAIGDSLTRGVGDATEGGGYVGILERTLNQNRHVATFENLGLPGNRSDKLLRRLDQPEIMEELEDADLVLITIGANDILKVTREHFTNLEIDVFIDEQARYEERLKQILEKIQSINENAEIYLLGIYNPFEKYFQDIEELNQIVNAWNTTGSDLTMEMENVTFIPIDDLFADNENPIFADDNFHPNYAGYYLMAERVLEYISKEEEEG